MSFFSTQTNLIDSPALSEADETPRAALVVYRQLMGQPHFLLISTRRDASRLTLPGGKVDDDEPSLQSAIRETVEEAGVLTDRHQPLGLYEHEKTSGKIYPTQTFIARYAGYESGHEQRELHWLTVAELRDSSRSIRRAVIEQIEQAAESLPAYTAAS
ncbi:MAG: NUDIX domain-containing protein [Phycisphaeraceae bacterium]